MVRVELEMERAIKKAAGEEAVEPEEDVNGVSVVRLMYGEISEASIVPVACGTAPRESRPTSSKSRPTAATSGGARCYHGTEALPTAAGRGATKARRWWYQGIAPQVPTAGRRATKAQRRGFQRCVEVLPRNAGDAFSDGSRCYQGILSLIRWWRGATKTGRLCSQRPAVVLPTLNGASKIDRRWCSQE